MTNEKLTTTTLNGKTARLKIETRTDDEFILKGRAGETVLLADSSAPEGCKTGDELDVFVFSDNDGQLLATTQQPKAPVGQSAMMKAITVTAAGAFMDWGIEKDLLVPVSQQLSPMSEGRSYMVYVTLDPQQRIIGSSKLHRFLDERAKDMAPGEQVDLLIAAQTDLGFKAIINGTHLGVLYKDEVFRPLAPGDRLKGFIKTIRDDKKIDLALQRQNKQSRDDLSQRILDFLQANGGTSSLTDYSPPEAIYKQYQVSKGNYKKALGALYKARKISLSRDAVTLLD